MKNRCKELFKLLILFVIGGLSYFTIELLQRGYSHWTMAVVGGFCFVLIGGLNEYLPQKMKIWKQAIIGSIMVTSVEFIAGVILNLYLKLEIQDYSNMPLNLLGQICLPFSIIWIILSAICIVLDDWLRYILFKESKPKYYL